MNKKLIITVLVAIVAAGGGFFGGIKYTQNQRTALRVQFANGQVMGRQIGNFRPVNGEVLSVDDKSMTVKLPDGSSKMIVLSGTTIISKSDTAAVADIKIGDKVGVFGTENSDGSVTAQSVQLNFQINRP